MFMDVVTRGFHLDNMIGAFFSALGLFSIARLGGIPVPSSREGYVLWSLIMVIQVLEYVVVLGSAIMIVLAYFHVRHFHRNCMYEAFGFPVADVAAAATLFATPIINQSLLNMFIYSYVISTCLKVRNAVGNRNAYQPLSDEDGSSSSAVKRSLVHYIHAEQRLPIAAWHVRVAFLGIALSFVISVCTLGIFASICFYPTVIAMVLIIKLTCMFVRWLEDDLCNGRTKSEDPLIRHFTGWFRDISYYMAFPRSSYLHGFRVWAVVQYPRIEFTGLFGDAYRERVVGDMDQMGGGDANFINMAYGFSVFFVCIAVAPATCYGVWIGLPVILGTLPYSEAEVLIQLYYEELWDLFVSFADAVARLQIDWDWPDWFNIYAVIKFCQNPLEMLVDAFLNLSSALWFLNLDLDRLIESSRALLQLNSVLAAAKPLAAALLQLWVVGSNGMKLCSQAVRDCTGYSDAKPSKPTHLRVLLFGQLVPGKEEIELAAKLRDLKTNPRPVPTLKSEGYTATDLMLGGFSVEKLRPTYSVTELVRAPFPLEQMREAGVSSADLKSADVTAASMRDAGYSAQQMKESFGIKELRRAGYTAQELKGTFGIMEMLGAYSIPDLLNAQFPLEQMREAAVSSADLQSAGVTAASMRRAGYSVQELKGTFKDKELKKAGFSASELER